MTQDEFERSVLRMWTGTRIALTRANVQAYTGAPRAKVEPWLDALCHAGLLDVDSDDQGELVWRVRGAERSANGPRTVGDAETLARLERELSREPRALAVRAPDRAWVERYGGRERKSLVASGLLGFFFGPLGWLYAAPLREALPAILAWMLVGAVMPHGVLSWILGLASPLSALLAVAYAHRYNQRGHRAGLFSSGGSAQPKALPAPRR